MTEPLAPLDALGARFRRLGEPPAPRRNPLPRALVIGVALALLLAGVAAAGILISRGAPLPAPNAVDLGARAACPSQAARTWPGSMLPDPDAAAPPWDIRISRTRAGEACTAVGQVLGGQFGIVGLDHVFRALPLGGVDACGVQSPNGPLLAGARVFLGDATTEARTVVNGLAGAGASSVTATNEGARKPTLGPEGSFVAVYRGYVEDVRPRIVVVTADGHSHTIAFASSAVFEVADPDGGTPWEASGNPALSPGAYPDENCRRSPKSWSRDPRREGASLTPVVCGRLGKQPLFVLMRRFVPGSGEGTGYPWGNKPARTLVYGAISRRVASLTLSGAGAPPGLCRSTFTAACSLRCSTVMWTRMR